jgi:TonB family protein
MATTAQHLLGQLVDGRYPLRRLLGVSPDSAVFLTDLPNSRPSEPAPEAAIKLIPEDPETSDAQLRRWRAAAALSHPGILHIIGSGRCSVDGAPCLFLVMELATENLGDVLSQRALTPDEAIGMMTPVLAALDLLHEKGFVHAGLKPSNVLAVRDSVKLSPDRIIPAGESCLSRPLASPYSPPESVLFPASDIWSLGVTLYETLTQYLPQRDSGGHYVLPHLASPFSEIVRGALVEDATQRIPLDDVRSALDPSFVPRPKPAIVPPAVSSPAPVAPAAEAAPLAAQAAAAAASAAVSQSPAPAALPHVDPLAVPLSSVSPAAAAPQPPARIPVSSLPNVNASIGSPRRVPAEPPLKQKSAFNFFFMGAAGTLLLAILIIPKLLRSPSDSHSSPVKSSAPASQPSTQPAAPPSPISTAPANANPAGAKSDAPSSASHPKPSENAASAKPPARPISRVSDDASAPEVVHQVIPEVSAKARSTIRGTVRINVRVQLNPDGSVSSADLDSPAPSRFFADAALKAARGWRFAPSAASSALLRFDFTSASSTASVAN